MRSLIKNFFFSIICIAIITLCFVGCTEKTPSTPQNNTTNLKEPISTTITTNTETNVTTKATEPVSTENNVVSSASIEAILLGDSNAFVEFNNATKYNECYEEQIKNMVFVLAEAFYTAKLGTPQAIASIHGLIPEDVYCNYDTLDSKMNAIYNYLTTSKLNYYFYLKFNSDGSISSVNILIDNVKKYVEDGIACGVFTGSWEEWDLSSEITSLDDFCKKMNVTKEVSIAFFEVMETYDVSWLDGDSSSFLDNFVK